MTMQTRPRPTRAAQSAPTPGRAAWPLWGMEASIVVADPGLLAEAEGIVRTVTSSVEDSCSRFRPDSELARLQPRLAAGVQVSPMLANLVGSALAAARWTDGDVDPTLGKDLEALGYDRDIRTIKVRTTGIAGPAARQDSGLDRNEPRPERRVPGWSRVSVVDGMLRVPDDVRLDLGATAKAVAADMAAASVHAVLGIGVLVSLGGDLSAAGPAPEGGWQVLVQDLPADPAQQVTLPAGCGMATSSTQKRRWHHAGTSVHHILDPRFGLPAEPVWRSVTVAASSCLEANAFSTAAVVRGFSAIDWFRSRGIAGRFVDDRGRTVTTGCWPTDRAAAEGGRHE